ncbi:hypothetical protein LCGC14_2222140 [marine sediment metagenome]|uniref:HTH cro/C1-type domain-containing protein n=1 Tax=marine sediment metagenome TaxID=412755 RepID=A0A0F9DAQ0_9ZZZZ
MTPAAFKSWRSRLAISQADAATLLNRSLRSVQAYEAGFEVQGLPRPIPKEIRLAMWAIEEGVLDWDGQEMQN